MVRILNEVRASGATRGELFTGAVTHEIELARYTGLAATGGRRFGGKVVQIAKDEFKLVFESIPEF